MKKINIIFLSVLFASNILFTSKAQSEIRVGVSIRMLSDAGFAQGKLFEEEVKKWNAAGGINKVPVKLIMYNDECKSEKGVANATKLAYQDNVHVIVGSSCSSVTLPMVPVVTKAMVPQLIPHSTSADITQQKSDYVFRVPISSRFYNLVQSRFTAETAGKKLAHIISPDSASVVFSESMIKHFKDVYKTEPAYVARVGEKETDFRSFLLKAKAANPDAIVCSGSVDETVRCLVQSYEVGIPKKVARVAGSIASKQEIPINAGDAAIGVSFAAAFADSDTRPAAQAFVTKIKSTYNMAPDHDFSQMQDLADILKTALERAQKKFTGNLAADRNAIRDALAATTNFSGLAAGSISFCADNSPQCRDGNRSPIMIEYSEGGKNWKTKVSKVITFDKDAGL